MNLFRLLFYVLVAALVVLLAALVAMLAEVATSGGEVTPEVRTGLVVLFLVVLLLLLLLWILLCLARARERLAEEKRLYRQAHGEDRELRQRAEEELRSFAQRKLELGRCARICDALVRRKFPRDCLRLPIDVTRHPDPCIYSQFFLMANGQPVTWDNPNVEILLGAIPQDTYNLSPSTDYEVRVGIENASPFFDALATQVQVNLLTFGVGGPSPTPIHSFVKDVPAATTFPGVPESFGWTSPATPGHYCIQVLITHPDDLNPGNNEGWNNTVVQDVAAGQAFRLAIPVRNPLRLERKGRRDDAALERLSEIRLTVDSYELRVTDLPSGDPDVILAPRPPDWQARVTPERLTLAPGGQAEARVELEAVAPAGAAPGTRAGFNVSATAGGRPIGGVSVQLTVR